MDLIVFEYYFIYSGIGKLKHNPKKVAMRRLGGRRRVEIRSTLQHSRPAKLLTKKYASKELDLDSLASGNYTAVQSLKKYQNIRGMLSDCFETLNNIIIAYQILFQGKP